ncbi:hypothetical protein C8R44DRAFT_742247 [Mycena epipterygia]|nr:hypothetical protein C8R44DRAFT_742247 [Mycena epipterygia]
MAQDSTAGLSAHEKWPLGLRRQERSGNGNPTTGAPRAQRYELIALGFMGIGGAVVELQSTQVLLRNDTIYMYLTFLQTTIKPGVNDSMLFSAITCFTAYCSDVGNDGTGEHPEAKIPTLS